MKFVCHHCISTFCRSAAIPGCWTLDLSTHHAHFQDHQRSRGWREFTMRTCISFSPGISLALPSIEGKDAAYYTEVAHACDSIMVQHPPSSTDSVTLYAHMVLPYTLELSGSDPSLPKIVRASYGYHILVSTNRVFIDIPPDDWVGFGVVRETWRDADGLLDFAGRTVTA